MRARERGERGWEEEQRERGGVGINEKPKTGQREMLTNQLPSRINSSNNFGCRRLLRTTSTLCKRTTAQCACEKLQYDRTMSRFRTRSHYRLLFRYLFLGAAASIAAGAAVAAAEREELQPKKGKKEKEDGMREENCYGGNQRQAN